MSDRPKLTIVKANGEVEHVYDHDDGQDKAAFISQLQDHNSQLVMENRDLKIQVQVLEQQINEFEKDDDMILRLANRVLTRRLG